MPKCSRQCAILVLGGTSETAPAVAALLAVGYRVLVSTATGIALSLPDDPRVERRSGPLDARGMIDLIRERRLAAVVDVTHPYAVEVKKAARRAADECGVPYLRLERATAVRAGESVPLVSDHEGAARLAASLGRPILLTTGSRNLTPYVREAAERGIAIFARVLPESRQVCVDAGIPPENIIAGRGPFSVEENRDQIRRYGIGVLVTKDGGEAGGVPAKLEAARQESCRVVVVKRPASDENAYGSIRALVAALRALVKGDG